MAATSASAWVRPMTEAAAPRSAIQASNEQSLHSAAAHLVQRHPGLQRVPRVHHGPAQDRGGQRAADGRADAQEQRAAAWATCTPRCGCGARACWAAWATRCRSSARRRRRASRRSSRPPTSATGRRTAADARATPRVFRRAAGRRRDVVPLQDLRGRAREARRRRRAAAAARLPHPQVPAVPRPHRARAPPAGAPPPPPPLPPRRRRAIRRIRRALL